MARISARRLVQLVEALEPRIRDAFLDAVRGARNEASVSRVAELLEVGHVDGVLTALGLNAARFNDLAEAVRAAYLSGGRQGVTEIPAMALRVGGRGPVLGLNFDIRNPVAEAWLRRNSSRLVTEVVASQREAIRTTLTAGMSAGQGPRQTALDIVGRIGVTGRRAGGIVGLTGQQAQFVANMRAELASGDAATMARYFGRVRRDKRLDGIVRRAIKAGKPVSQADIDRISGRYSDRLLQLRGETIARTEGTEAFNAARDQAFRQAVEEGRVRAEWVRKVWQTTLDGRERDSHAALNGVEVQLGQPFMSPTGAWMEYPGDTSHGAGGDDVINCRCMAMYRVDMVAATMEA